MSEAASPTPRLGIVVIGRNEGENLRRCLLSIPDISAKVVYSDSGSTDGSIALAEHLGAFTVSLDRKKPFTAARGRNEGFNYLMHIAPETEYVQFIDGDCEIVPGWLESATRFLQENTQYSIVCGRLKERHPHKSIYNRLFDAEWDGPTGDIDSCGGIFLIRASPFETIGRMNENIAAGEEPELCFRLRNAGWRVARLNKLMALHDVNILHFSQWWRRAIRTGHGALEVYLLTNRQVFSTHVKRTLLWTLGWLCLLAMAMFPVLIGGRRELVIFPLLAAALQPIQVARMAFRGWRKGLSLYHSIAYGALLVIGKWAELIGNFSYIAMKLR